MGRIIKGIIGICAIVSVGFGIKHQQKKVFLSELKHWLQMRQSNYLAIMTKMLVVKLLSNQNQDKHQRKRYPKVKISKKCNACSLKDICLPKLNQNPSVDKYFDINIIKENKTTKEDKENHGLGLITINNIILKYNGSIDYSVTNQSLVIDITLLNVLKI